MENADWTGLPAARLAAEAGRYGALVRLARAAAGLTLAEAGHLVGYSAATMSRLERGRQPLTDVTVLRRLSLALSIPARLFGLTEHSGVGDSRHRANAASVRSSSALDTPEGGDLAMRRRGLLTGLAGLTGSAVVPAGAAAASGSTADPGGTLADALEGVLLRRPQADLAGEAEPVAPAVLRHALAAVQRDFQACRYRALTTGLPRLVAAAEASAAANDGDDQFRAQATLAEVYNVATMMLVKLSRERLSWVSSDRAMSAARHSGDAVTFAQSSRMFSIVARRAGYHDSAQAIALRGAELLDIGRHSASAEHLSLYGVLLASAGYTAARAGDRHRSQELLADAAAAARLEVDHGFTAFGPDNVTLFRISSAYVLGDMGTAIEHARTVRPATIPAIERQTRYWVDVARAFYRWGKPDRCYRALLTAERLAPEEARSRPVFRGLVADLLSGPGQTSMPNLRGLAGRVGAAA